MVAPTRTPDVVFLCMALVQAMFFLTLLLVAYGLVASKNMDIDAQITGPVLGGLTLYYTGLTFMAAKGIRRIQLLKSGFTIGSGKVLALTRCSYAFEIIFLIPMLLLNLITTIISFLIPCSIFLPLSLEGFCELPLILSVLFLVYHSIMLGFSIKGIINIQAWKRLPDTNELETLITV